MIIKYRTAFKYQHKLNDDRVEDFTCHRYHWHYDVPLVVKVTTSNYKGFVDFKALKRIVWSVLDEFYTHDGNANIVLDVDNATAESISQYICGAVRLSLHTEYNVWMPVEIDMWETEKYGVEYSER